MCYSVVLMLFCLLFLVPMLFNAGGFPEEGGQTDQDWDPRVQRMARTRARNTSGRRSERVCPQLLVS